MSARDEAKSHFERGLSLQGGRAYDQAIIEYQAAYAIMPMPELLFNIGQCFRLSGDAAHAILYYERYLEIVGNGGAADEARAHIHDLRTPAVAAKPPPAPPSPPSTSSRSAAWRWLGAGSATLGVLLVGTGLWFGLEANHAEGRIESATGEFTPELEAVQRDGKTDDRRMLILTTTGATLVLAGGFTWWLSRPRTQVRRFEAGPLLRSGAVGLSLSGTF
jgi:tetratricopeptide (TPR) repeat protein